MNRTTVIYHSADFDGIFCREIAKKFLPDAELIGWNHGDPLIPFPEEGYVYLLDLSPQCLVFPPPEFGMSRLFWIDHHATAIAKFPSSIYGYRIDGVAACRLAWQWFNNDHADFHSLGLPKKEHYVDRIVDEPYAVRLAGEYDIWDKRDPNADIFQMGLRSQELTPEVWKNLLDREVPESLRGTWAMVLINQGVAVQYAKTHENESIIKHAGFTLKWEGLTFLAVNHARYNSFLFTAGLKPEHDACYGFAYRNGQWTVSLYHAPGKEHHDLAKIAVKYGGGGHKGACGFQAKTLPFLTP
jgi:hypothetical protein